MDASLWDDVAAASPRATAASCRSCRSGRTARRCTPDADLSLPGIARLVAEFLDGSTSRTSPSSATTPAARSSSCSWPTGAARIGGAVLVSCDAFDNFPPGLTGRTLFLTGKLPPGLFGMFMQQMRLRAVRRLPMAFGWLTKRGDAVAARWLRPI